MEAHARYRTFVLDQVRTCPSRWSLHARTPASHPFHRSCAPKRPYTRLMRPPHTPLTPLCAPAHPRTHPCAALRPRTYTPLSPYQGSAVTYHLSGRKVRAAPPCAAGGEVPGAKAAPDTPGAATPAAHGACRVACTGLAEAPPPPEGAERGAHHAGFVRGAAWGSAVVAGLDRVRAPAAAGTRPFRGRCFACGQKGHSKDHCPQWRRADLDGGLVGSSSRHFGSASREPAIDRAHRGRS